MVAASFELLHSHPYFLTRIDLALWSINERLAGREGTDIDPPNQRWIDDIHSIAQSNRDALADLENEIHGHRN